MRVIDDDEFRELARNKKIVKVTPVQGRPPKPEKPAKETLPATTNLAISIEKMTKDISEIGSQNKALVESLVDTLEKVANPIITINPPPVAKVTIDKKNFVIRITHRDSRGLISEATMEEA